MFFFFFLELYDLQWLFSRMWGEFQLNKNNPTKQKQTNKKPNQQQTAICQ